MSNYILYKESKDEEIMYVLKYLHSQGFSYIPQGIIERGIPIEISKLPSLYDIDEKKLYHGMEETVKYFEKRSKIAKILQKIKLFKISNPDYELF